MAAPPCTAAGGTPATVAGTAAPVPAPDGGACPFRTLVVDTNALIHGAGLRGLAQHYVTVEGVLHEIRDEHARARLAALPFKLETRLPHHDSVAAVRSFATKTGDLPRLSAVDVQLLALAHQMEKEANGTRFIRAEPARPVPAASPPPPAASTPTTAPARAAAPPSAWAKRATGVSFAQVVMGSGGGGGGTAAASVASTDEGATPPTHTSASTEAATVMAEDDGRGDGSGVRDEVKEEGGGDAHADEAEEEVEATSGAGEGGGDGGAEGGVVEEGDEMDSDDGCGLWIRPSGGGGGKGVAAPTLPFGYMDVAAVAKVDDAADAAALPTDRVRVATLTSDFGMQNVMLQMGLLLASASGHLVRQVKSWVMKCDGCFTIVPDTNKKFCPKCGNATLKRLGVTVRADGSPDYHYKAHRTFNNRGTIFPLPRPEGGREGKGDLLLREDQLLMGHWAVKARTTKSKPGSGSGAVDLDASVAAWVTGKPSRGDRGIVVGVGRRNPNEVRGRRR